LAKMMSDACIDGGLDYLATCTIVVVCSAEPATYAEMATTYDLATHVLAGGDWAKANGDGSGRKVTCAAQAGITIDHSGTATHVAFGISASSTLVAVTTCTSQALTAAGTVDIPAIKNEIADPT
jgi:hypothetical protein